MIPGQRLYPGQNVSGTDGSVLRLQEDGNLVLYVRGTAVWATGTFGAPAHLEMQVDGNLVLYFDGQGPAWASGTTAAGARLVVSRTGLAIVASMTIWRTPPVPDDPQPEPNRLLPLSVENNRRYFRTDAGRFEWREVSRFSMLARIARGEHGIVRELIRADRTLGFTMSRQIITLWGDYWRDFIQAPNQPDYLTNLHALVQMHAEEGMYVRICMIGALDWAGGQWDESRRDFFTGEVRAKAEAFCLDVARELRDYPHVVFEIANEPTQIGMRDSWPAIVALGHRIKAAAPNVLLCGGEDNECRGLVEPFDFADAHLPRDMGVAGWEWIKRSGEMLVIDQPTRYPDGHRLAGQATGFKPMPFVAGEDANMGEARRDGRTGDVESQPANCFGAAAVHRARRVGGVCFHWDGGLWTTPMQPITVECAKAWHDALDAFPMRTDAMWRGHWGLARGDYWRDMWPDTDDLREVERHVRDGHGAWRAFGCGPDCVVFPLPQEFDWRRHLEAPAERRGFNARGVFACAVFRRSS